MMTRKREIELLTTMKTKVTMVEKCCDAQTDEFPWSLFNHEASQCDIKFPYQLA